MTYELMIPADIVFDTEKRFEIRLKNGVHSLDYHETVGTTLYRLGGEDYCYLIYLTVEMFNKHHEISRFLRRELISR